MMTIGRILGALQDVDAKNGVSKDVLGKEDVLAPEKENQGAM